MTGTVLWIVGVVILLGAIVGRRVRPRADIAPNTLDPGLDWGQAADGSLNKVYDYAVAFSNSTIGWYQTRRQPKRFWGVSVRLAALVLTTVAGLVPLADQFGLQHIPGVLSTVMLALAGVCVSIDAFGGFTSGWVRYMLAQQKVERLRDAFLIEWNALKLAKTDATAMLERAKAFVLAVGKVVDDETQEWATQFQNALNEMDKARKAAMEAERTGALEISVKNAHDVTDWVFEVDGNQRGRTSGRNLAITDIAVGLRRLRAVGEKPDGKRVSDEKTVKIEGGATVAKEFELT